MKANNTNKPFTITINGVTKVTSLEPKEKVWGTINLQVEMFWYDLLHRTQYRQIRNQLIRQKRNEVFELKIGISKK